MKPMKIKKKTREDLKQTYESMTLSKAFKKRLD